MLTRHHQDQTQGEIFVDIFITIGITISSLYPIGVWTMFQKIKASRICDTVVKDIEEAAISGQLKPGDKLPAERVLSESLAFLSYF